MSDQMFFLFGPQRSGARLLASALDSHPDIQCFKHPTSLKVLQDVRVLTIAINGSPAVGFELSSWHRYHKKLLRAYPKASIVFIRRELKHVVASMLKHEGAEGRTWAKSLAIQEMQPDLELWKHTEFYWHAYRMLESYGFDHLVMACMCAYVKDVASVDIWNECEYYHEVQYEDLCADPDFHMAAIVDFLGVEWNDAVKKYHLDPSYVESGFDPVREEEENGNPSWDLCTSVEQSRIESFLADLAGADKASAEE